MKVTFADSFWKSADRCFSNNPIYAVPRFFRNVRRAIKYAYQRVNQGFDETAVWDFYHTEAERNIAILTLFKNQTGPFSQDFTDQPFISEGITLTRTEVIDKILQGFIAAKTIGDSDYYVESEEVYPEDEPTEILRGMKKLDTEKTHAEYERLMVIFNEGMDWYKRYFFFLWD